jgi:hypothetical protein
VHNLRRGAECLPLASAWLEVLASRGALMHFFYLDESGDTGANLLGGLSVADKKWNNTKEALDQVIAAYFNGAVPANFELHATELLSPTGEGPFKGHAITDRLTLVHRLLGLLDDLGHYAHYFAIDKSKAAAFKCEFPANYNAKIPYVVAFDYLITYINWHVKENLGQSARGMLVLDEKPEHHDSIESIIHHRRFNVPSVQKVKWIVEFSYPVDSKKNPMIQLSDLVILCIRRFLEIELGHKPATPQIVKNFYAACFHRLSKRIKNKSIIQRKGKNLDKLTAYLEAIQAKPPIQWRKNYDI